MWGCRLSCWSVWHCQCIPFMQCIFTQKKKKPRQSNFNSCNNKLKKKLQHLPRQWCSTDKVSRHGWEMVDTYLLKICSGRRLRRGSLPEESWRRSPWDWQSRTSSLTETSHLRQSSVSLTVLEGVRLCSLHGLVSKGCVFLCSFENLQLSFIFSFWLMRTREQIHCPLSCVCSMPRAFLSASAFCVRGCARTAVPAHTWLSLGGVKEMQSGRLCPWTKTIILILWIWP